MPVSLLCSLYIPFSGCVLLAQCVLRSEITGQELLLAICSEQLIPVSFSPWCMVVFSTSVSSVYCLLSVRAERDSCTQQQCCFILRRVNTDGPARHQRLRCVEPKLERDRGATLRLNKYTVTGVTSRFNAASERFVVMSVLGLAVAFLQIFVDRGVYIRQSSVVTEPSAVKVASSQQVGNVEVSLVQGLVFNSCSLCFGCGSVQGGPATCSGACECSDSCWIKYDTPTVTVYSVNDCGNRNSGVCEGQESAQEAPATVNRQTRGNLFGAFDSCVPFFSVFVGLLTSVSSVYCLLWVRAQRYCCTEQQF